ncbi:MAG: alpha/beta hydrolase family protein [Anaerolineae bacterium]
MKNHLQPYLSLFLAAASLAWLVGCDRSKPTAESSGPFPTLSASTATPTVEPAATPQESTSASSPLAIELMRAKQYPGSPLTVENTLSGGAGYSRYIASYESDGLKLYGLLTVPTGVKPQGGWPVLLLNHGYIPPSEYSTSESYARIDALLAQAGYIVFKPDYRGNGNSPGTPCQIYICPDYVTDSLNALASIQQFPDANPDKVGVWGHSMGGNITLHELVVSPAVKAAVIMAGVVGSYSDVLDWWNARLASGVLTTQNDQQTKKLVDELVRVHGTPQSNPAYWDPMDPTKFIADVQAPVLIQVGSQDTVVPPKFSRNLAAQLQAAGKNVALHEYPGADHNLAPDTTQAVQEALAFFDQYLK